MMSAPMMMVAAGQPGLLELLSRRQRPATRSALERVGKLGQLIGLCRISVVRGPGRRGLQLARELGNDGLKLLRTLRLDLLQLGEKLRCRGEAEHISLLLDRRS